MRSGERTWAWLPAPRLLAALVLSIALKASLQVAGVLDFTGDEGVVALMARHITQGNWPVFYYGEAHVGSLGATLIAAAFLLAGQPVASVRVVQMLFSASAVLFAYLLTERGLSSGRPPRCPDDGVAAGHGHPALDRGHRRLRRGTALRHLPALIGAPAGPRVGRSLARTASLGRDRWSALAQH